MIWFGGATLGHQGTLEDFEGHLEAGGATARPALPSKVGSEGYA